MASPLAHEKVWFEKPKFEAAERQYYERLAKVVFGSCVNAFALNSALLPLAAIQTQLKASSLMDNKVCYDVENYSVSQKNNKKTLDLKEDGTSICPVVMYCSADKTNPTAKEEKQAKKEKKIRKKDLKKDHVKTRLCDQDNAQIKSNSCSVSNTKQIFGSNNTRTSSSNRENLLENNPSGEQQKSPNMKSTLQVYEVKGKIQSKDVLGANTCALGKYHPNVLEENQKFVFEKGSSNSPMKHSLASEVAKARQHIKKSLECVDGIAAMAGNNSDLINRINSLEKENTDLKKVVEDLKKLALSLDSRVKILEGGKATPSPVTLAKPSKPAKNEDDDDDGVDLFGSDSEEETEEAAKIREQRLAAYAEKKSKKPALIAKSNIILSVSPWDDETDMKKMEECVRTIHMDGLVWGASKLVPLAYGIHKLHISCVVEDDKVSVDLLQENIQNFEDYVQSVDIAAFNKV